MVGGEGDGAEQKTFRQTVSDIENLRWLCSPRPDLAISTAAQATWHCVAGL